MSGWISIIQRGGALALLAGLPLLGMHPLAAGAQDINCGGSSRQLVPVGDSSVAPDTFCSPAGCPENLARLDFHDASLETVLNYFSSVYGFIITGQTDLEGKFTMMAGQQVGSKEAIALLNTELAKTNYQAVLSGRILKITTMDAAKRSAGTPVQTSERAADIPRTDNVVTEVLPLHSLNPAQLATDLQGLCSEKDTITANDAGNAIIVTACQSDVRRMAEIIEALDSTTVTEVRVFVLKYADAKSVAQEIKDVFTDPNIQTKNLRYAVRVQDGTDAASDNSKVNLIPVNTVYDDRNNAVLVSAPLAYLDAVSNIVSDLDQPAESVTVARVFHLSHADPAETAAEVTTLFASDNSRTGNSSDRYMGYRYVSDPAHAGPSHNPAGMRRRSQVIALPDYRTGAVIVSASADLIRQIGALIRDLDRPDPQRQVVESVSFGSSDASEIQGMMQDLFQDPKSRRAGSSQAATALQQRQIQNAQQQSTTPTGFNLTGQRTR